MNLTVANSPYRVDPQNAPPVPPGDNLPPAPIDPSIDKWFFISVTPFLNSCNRRDPHSRCVLRT